MNGVVFTESFLVCPPVAVVEVVEHTFVPLPNVSADLEGTDVEVSLGWGLRGVF